MQQKRLFYIGSIIGLFVFTIFIVQRADTNKIRRQETGAMEVKLEVATDPTFQEFKGEIVTGFPGDFPVFPGAILVGSVVNNPAGVKDTGYRVMWNITKDNSVSEIVNWYVQELRNTGWNVEDPDLWENISELVLQIEKENFKGYIAAESEENVIELVVDLKIQ